MTHLTTPDGVRLLVRRWPAPGPAHGTVQIVHGLGEHIGRYEWVAAQLAARGWQVVGHDQRGHGQSEGARGAVPARASLLADLAQVIDHVRAPGPHVLLGHSMGGLVAARFVAEGVQREPAPWWRQVDGLVLSSPALAADLNTGQRLALALLGPLAPGLGMGNGLQPEWISRDPEVVRAYVQDALVHDRITPRLARFIVDEGAAVRACAARWNVPTLLMWAGADRCVAPWGSAEMAAAAPRAVLTAQPFAGFFHEIFNEPERAQVLDTLVRWLARFEAGAGTDKDTP